jgi:hypothetical protein
MWIYIAFMLSISCRLTHSTSSYINLSVEGRVNQQTSPQDLNSIDKRMKKRTKNEREVKPNPRWGEDKQLHGADEL